MLLVTDGNYFLERAIQNMHLKSPDIMQTATYEEQKPTKVRRDSLRPLHAYLSAGGGELHLLRLRPAGQHRPGQKITAVNDAAGNPVLLADEEILDWQRDNPMLKDLALNRLYVAQALKLNVPLDAQTLIDGLKGPLVCSPMTGNGRIWSSASTCCRATGPSR